jgi:hypothetical protein
MKCKLLALFLLLLIMLLNLPLPGSELDPVTEVYSELSNLYDPSEEDLYKLQDKLSNTYRPIIERMNDTAFIMKNFKLIGKSPDEKPEYGRIAVNSSWNDRENCIIIYASFNRNYPKGVRRLVNTITHSNFRGHVHYRIGGWPNVSEGDLALAHVPFAFKLCFFREMKKLGYKRVLWLDSSILPWVNLNTIFQMIQDKGFLVQGNSHDIGIYMNNDSAAAFGLTLNETYAIPSCSAAILGIDFTNQKTAHIIDAWYRAAKDPFAFFSARSDQNALSIILYQMGLINEMWPNTTLGSPHQQKNETLFLMDREFVKDR